MANQLVNFHRRHFPNDPRSDDQITLAIANDFPDRFTDVEDFQADVERIRKRREEFFKPSLTEEAGLGLRRGVEGLKSTGYGAAALASEGLGLEGARDKFIGKAAEAQERAGEAQGTVPRIEDIESVDDAVRYVTGSIPEVAPSLVSSLASGGFGALLSKAAVNKLIKKKISDLTKRQAAQIGAVIGVGANSFGLSSGEIYNSLLEKGADPESAFNYAVGFGSVAAIPDTALPAAILNKFIKGGTKESAQRFVIRLFQDAAKTVPLEAGTEGFQEFVNIAAERYHGGGSMEQPLTDEERSRILNAGALGAVGGGVAAPLVTATSGGGAGSRVKSEESRAESGIEPVPNASAQEPEPVNEAILPTVETTPVPSVPRPRVSREQILAGIRGTTTDPLGLAALSSRGPTRVATAVSEPAIEASVEVLPPEAPATRALPAPAQEQARPQISREDILRGIRGEEDPNLAFLRGGELVPVSQAREAQPEPITATTSPQEEAVIQEADQLVEQVDFDRGVFESESTGIISRPVESVQDFDHTPEQVGKLAQKLVTDARAGETDSRSLSIKGLAVIDRENNEVVILGAHKSNRNATIVVNPDPGRRNLNIHSFLNQKTQDGERRFQPLAIIRFKEPQQGRVVRVKNQDAFNTFLLQSAQLTRSTRPETSASIPELQTAGRRGEQGTEVRIEASEEFQAEDIGTQLVNAVDEILKTQGIDNPTPQQVAQALEQVDPDLQAHLATYVREMVMGDERSRVLVGRFMAQGLEGELAKRIADVKVELLNESITKKRLSERSGQEGRLRAGARGSTQERGAAGDLLEAGRLSLSGRTQGSIIDVAGVKYRLPETPSIAPRANKVLYRNTSSRVFFSQAERVVQDKVPARVSPDQLRAILTNPKNGIKKAELEWLGLNQFLTGKTGNLSKDEVLAWVRSHRVELRDVDTGRTYTLQQAENDKDTFDSPQQSVERFNEGFAIRLMSTADGNYSLLISKDFAGEPNVSLVSKQGTIPLPGVDASKVEIGKLITGRQTGVLIRLTRDFIDIANRESRGGLTSYEQHTLDGGSDYTEFLMVAPGGFQDADLIEAKKKFHGGGVNYLSTRDGRFIARARHQKDEDGEPYTQLILLHRGGMWIDEPIPYFNGGEFSFLSTGSFKRSATDALREAVDRIVQDPDLNRRFGGSETDSDSDIDIIIGESSQPFVSRHFEEFNIVAHTRFNTRYDANKNKVLFLEEVQSDWGQELRSEPGSAPDMPFKSNWHELSMKRMIRYAAEKGFAKIGWTTGSQQNERYRLSKYIDVLTVESTEGAFGSKRYTVGAFKNDDLNDPIIFRRSITESELESTIGKEMTKRVLKDLEGKTSTRIEGKGLEIGGDGMKGFYDQIIPSFVKKYTKKWGSTVRQESVDGHTVWTVDVTPEMVESVLENGQPLFSRPIPPVSESSESVKAAFHRVLQSVNKAGGNVQIFEQDVNSLVGFVRQQGGAVDSAARIVALTLADVNNPTVSNLKTALHEAAHFLFGRESLETQASILKAIESLSDIDLNLTETEDARIALDNPAGLDFDTLMEERLVESLAQTIDPTQARGLVRQLLDFLREVWVRAVGAYQRAVFGSVSPEVALDLFRVQFQRFVRGGSAFSVKDWFGGPVGLPHFTHLSQAPADGESAFNYAYDADIGDFVFRPMLPESAESILHNLNNALFTKPGDRSDVRRASPDQDPAIVLPDIAAQNTVGALIQNLDQYAEDRDDLAAHRNFILEGTRLTNMRNPQVVKATILEELNRLGKQVPQGFMETTIEQLPNEFSQREAANKVFQMVERLRNDWKSRYNQAVQDSGEEGKLIDRVQKLERSIAKISGRFEDAEVFFSGIKDDLLKSLKQVRVDARRTTAFAHKMGNVMRGIQDFEGESMGQELREEYVKVINKLANELADVKDTQQKFFDVLEVVASMETNDGIPLGDLSRQEIIQLLRNTLQGTRLDQFANPETRRGKAIISLVADFAKSNSLAVEMLGIRRDRAAREVAQMKEIINEALRSQDESLTEARRMALRLPTAAAKMDRILQKLQGFKRQRKEILEEIERDQRFIRFYEKSAGDLRLLINQLGSIIGLQRDYFEAVEGAQIPIPPSKDANAGINFDDWKTHTYLTQRNEKQQKELNAVARKISDWLDNNERGTPAWNQLNQTLRKIRENQMWFNGEKQRDNVFIRLFGSIANKLDLIDSPIAAAINRRIRNFSRFDLRFKKVFEKLSYEWGSAEYDARQVLGFTQDQIGEFRRRWRDRPLKYIELRQDIRHDSKSDKEAHDRVMRALRLYLLSDPDAKPLRNDANWAIFDRYIRKSGEVSDRFRQAAQEMGAKVKEDGNGINGYFRDTVGAPLFEVSRKSSRMFEDMVDRMRPLWIDFKFSKEKTAQSYTENRDQLVQQWEGLIPQVIRDMFMRPLAYRPVSPFEGANGIASRDATVAAFENSKNAVEFAERLYELEEVEVPIDEFVAETLDTLHQYWSLAFNVRQKRSKHQKSNVESMEQLFMHARQSESFPAEWVDYMDFDLVSNRRILHNIIFNTVFGVNLESVRKEFDDLERQLSDRVADWEKIKGDAAALRGKARESFIASKAKAIGVGVRRLKGASRDLHVAQSVRTGFDAFINTQGSLDLDIRPWAELIGAMAGLVVQAPGTALIDTISLFKPLQETGLSTQSLKNVGSNIKSFASGTRGSFMNMFGASIKMDADLKAAKNAAGIFDPDTTLTLKERIKAVIESTQPATEGPAGRVGQGVTIAARSISSLLNTGFRPRGDSQDFFTAKPLNVFTFTGQQMHLSSVVGTWRAYEEMVMRASEFFKTNPDAAGDPDFTFSAKDLKYDESFGGLLNDQKSFDYLIVKLHRHGLTLEEMARDYLKRSREQKGASFLNDDAYQRLAPIGPNEITLESSIVSRPAGLLTNPWLHFASPLVGWSISQVASVAKSFHGPQGELDLSALKRAGLAFAAMAGIGLGYALLREEYDEKILGKKANVLTFAGASSADEAALALMDKLSRVGMFGIVGDFMNALVNVDTNRPFSVDSRVFAINSLLTLQRAMGTWLRQGTATYQSVGRPVIGALGGSGYLQYAQILNNAVHPVEIPILRKEAQAARRTNASNYIRVAGRQLELNVRTSRGFASVSTPVTPHVTSMILAAMSDDPAQFNSSYQKAIEAAREMGKEDPIDHVTRSFQSRHPLRIIFKTTPSQTDYQRILGVLNDDGREDVSKAVGLINRYGSTLGISPFTGKAPERKKVSRSSLLSGIRGSSSLNFGL